MISRFESPLCQLPPIDGVVGVGTFSPRPSVNGANGMVKADINLIPRAKAGDRFAFDELVGPLIDQAFRLAFGMLHDREAAEDAVQEATVRSWRKLDNLRAGTQMRPWFLAIVANQCRTTARGRWWSVLRLDNPQWSAGAGFEDRIVRGADLRAALRKLGLEQREALVLRYYLDLSLEEVAAITGVPVGTVKSRLNRGLTAMRPHFEPREALT
jgi:RNA polymerase sigma-70 factor (ECF subfamily)